MPSHMMGDDSAFATGILAGAGLREVSQVLSAAKKRSQPTAQPSPATSAQGNLGEIDKILMLARMQRALGQPPIGAGGGPMQSPLMQGPMAPPPSLGVPLQGGAPPLPMAGLPLGGGVPPPNPILAALMASRGGPPGPQQVAPGGGSQLPLQLLQQLLQGSSGIV